MSEPLCWTGQEARSFEREFAAFAGTEYAVAVANGTVALDLALKGLGIGPGDEVVVTSRTFLASASCIVTAGATPVFADVDRDSQNVTADSIRQCLSERTRAVICVHLAGWPCEMDAINALAREHGLAVIEDCAQAHGATYRGQPVGSLGDVGCWSFCQDKIMSTAGEGGMVTTSDRELWSRMWSYKDHGKSWEAVYEREHPPGFRWLHESFGTNWRMTEIQATVGRIQLGRMPQWHQQRLANCRAIWDTARNCPGLRVPEVPEHIEHAGYKCYVFVEPEQLAPGWDRDAVQQAIMARGVPCMSGSCSEVYLEKNFQDAGFWSGSPEGDAEPTVGAHLVRDQDSDSSDQSRARRAPTGYLPVARELGETSLMFLCHPTLTQAEIGKTCEVLAEVMQEAASL